MSRSQRQYLRDILDAMVAAESFVEGMGFDDLEDDLRTQYALQRAFEIIGEATKNVNDTIRASHPEIPWRKMAGMRDMLIHGYFAVDLEIVWDTVHERLPRERSRLHKVLRDLPKDPDRLSDGDSDRR